MPESEYELLKVIASYLLSKAEGEMIVLDDIEFFNYTYEGLRENRGNLSDKTRVELLQSHFPHLTKSMLDKDKN